MVGKNIRKFREEKGMTQKELALKMFVTTQAISRWENEKVEPSISSLIRLSEIFGVTIDELVK